VVKGGTTLNAVKSMTPKTYFKKHGVFIKMHTVRKGILPSFMEGFAFNFGERNVPNLVKSALEVLKGLFFSQILKYQ